VERVPLILQSHPDVWRWCPIRCALKNQSLGQLRVGPFAPYNAPPFSPMAGGASSFRWADTCAGRRQLFLKILEERAWLATLILTAPSPFPSLPQSFALPAISFRPAAASRRRENSAGKTDQTGERKLAGSLPKAARLGHRNES